MNTSTRSIITAGAIIAVVILLALAALGAFLGSDDRSSATVVAGKSWTVKGGPVRVCPRQPVATPHFVCVTIPVR